jgi:hypothetical protein
MGRKNVVKSYKMIDAGDLSGNITSSTTNVINLDKASVHLNWSGTSPVGVITVEARNGEGDSWYELDMGSTMNISGNSGNHQLLFLELPVTDIRIVYTFSSGVGTLDATFTSKVVGA